MTPAAFQYSAEFVDLPAVALVSRPKSNHAFRKEASAIALSREVVAWKSRPSIVRPPIAVATGDLCNLLQVAASALHLIDQQVEDDLRSLVQIGLSALRQAGQQCRKAGGSDVP